MLSKAQEKLIRSLKTKKGRQKEGLCLVEGEKSIETAADYVEYYFDADDTKEFNKLVTTVSPQMQAAVARIPKWEEKNILTRDITIVLDGVQDPGNVGSILRLCLGFNASLVMVDSVDVTNPKVIRSSAGAMFQVPWIYVSRDEIKNFLNKIDRPIYRLEKIKGAKELTKAGLKTPVVIIAGSEGQGIQIDLKAPSLFIKHDSDLESLNVGHALAITLHKIQS